MEEKRLDAAESLELIGRMIRNTRQRLERHSGRPFLIWGYTTVGISLLNYALNLTGADPNWSLSWFLIPVLGYTLMRLFPEKAAHRPAHGDRPDRPDTVAGLLACADPDFPALPLPRTLLPSEPLRAHQPHDVDRRRLYGPDRPLEDLHRGRIRGHGPLDALRLLRLLPEAALRNDRNRRRVPQLRDPDLRGHFPRDDGHPGPHHQLPRKTRKKEKNHGTC